MADLPKYSTRPDDDRTTIVMRPSGLTTTAVEPIHYLVVAEGPEHGRIVELGPAPLTIGRAAPSDVVLRDLELSRVHCKVQLERDAVIVVDLGSTNGTFVDGNRVSGPSALARGSFLRVGRHALKYDRGTPGELKENRDFDRSLEGAARYIRSLLPAPLPTGPVRTEWLLLPSKRLGGDAFGYHPIGENGFALYLFDVCGHGIDAAMLAVAVMNALRPHALAQCDFAQPAEMLRRLNGMFQMDAHGSMYFTMWYGFFDAGQRILHYASAGHHPAYLVPADRGESIPLWTRNLAVGITPDYAFRSESMEVPPSSTLYLFSDGVYEIDTADGRRWDLDDFIPLLAHPRVAGLTEPQRLYQAVQQVARRGPLEDDFTLLAVDFA
ncbi:MAG TPA: SpoIIE family protein phosphatase [Burkholderiales bacterium]|nr:SpoIIE family protein phosphatase [Burkholderiales bacterium]